MLGILLTTLGAAMMIPALIDLSVGNPDWLVFAGSGFGTLFVGVSLWLTMRGFRGDLSLKEAFVLTTGSWIVLVTFAAIPLAIAPGVDLSYVDAFFEAMSGLTTTGATVIVGLDDAPPGILAWRAILQWLGGIGIIVMAIAVLPMLQVGGMQIFRMESSDTSDKILPRARQISGVILSIYTGLTILCALAYWSFGLPAFDAIAHAMTTLATGGFSTSDRSIGNWPTMGVQYTAIVFMILSSLPFALYVHVVALRPLRLIQDQQVIGFLFIAATITALLAISLVVTGTHEGESAFRAAALNGVSVLSGTGYASEDYNLWGGFADAVLFFAMFIGGCAGSASCGIKVFRVQMIAILARTHMQKVIHPRGVFSARYNGQPIPRNVAASVMTFFFLYLGIYAVIATVLSLYGVDTLTAWSSAATTLANVGPGLGDIVGPTGSFRDLHDSAKIILSASMLLGRLELFTVLVLFLPSFWRS